MLKLMVNTLLFIGFILVQQISGDTPANCTFDDIQGSWLFSESDRSSSKKEICNGSQVVVNKLKVDLLFPDIAIDQYGNKG
jgi:cathepsin C